ncbi:MAG: hypothetical protein IKV57_01550 [Clostridia bacterium]|nr:hypothetical protein [Clostridia bacterium]
MKLSHKLTALLTACVMVLPLTGCSNPQYYRYDYDLSEYITLAEYKNLPVLVDKAEVTEEEVQQEILSTIMYFAQAKEVDRASAKGDTVKFSSTATLDGTEMPEFSEEDGSLTLGFAAYGDDVEAALTGVKAGDTVQAKRVIADNYADETLAGKTLQYTFHVTAVCEMEQQEYNDTFVKAYLGFNTVEEYETTLRQAMEASAVETQLSSKVLQTWTVVVENTEVLQYPEKEMNQITAQLLAELEAYTAGVGIKLDDYTQIRYGMTEEEFRANAGELAKEQMKQDMIIYAIARAEDLKISDTLYDQYAEMYMTQMGYASVEELESHYTKEAICEGILGDLVKECVAGYASVSYNE